MAKLGERDHPMRMYLRWWLVPVFASCMTVVSPMAAGADQSQANKGALEFEPERMLAVEAYQFGVAEVPFKVRNTGSKSVRILEITPRRGSGGGSADPPVLGPGETGRVLLRRQITNLGVRYYGFRVTTDEANDPKYPLRAYIFGQSAYTPDLPRIFIDNARTGRVTATRLTVTSYETDVLDLKAVLEKPAWVDIAVVKRGEGESPQELVLEVRIHADTPKGLNQGSMHLLTTVKGQPDLVIPIAARVFDTVSATPIPATMKPAHVGDIRELEITYRALDDKALTLEKVVDDTGVLVLRHTQCGAQCVKVTGTYATSAPGEVGGEISARFVGRAEKLDVGWDILVVPKGAVLNDLGVLGDKPLNIDGDAAPAGGKP